MKNNKKKGECKEYNIDKIVSDLRKHSRKRNLEGMARFGINVKNALGVNIPILRSKAKELGRNHELAEKLWNTKIHEVRILASMVDEPEMVTAKQMDLWTKEFNSWDLCDQCVMNLFEKTTFAYAKAVEYSGSKKEFVKRTGFVLMARLAVSDKEAPDSRLIKFFPIIKKHSTDNRNFVKKAVNWALRQIGKRNKNLNKLAITAANEINKIESRSAKWIASDALRELSKLKNKHGKQNKQNKQSKQNQTKQLYMKNNKRCSE